jgi:hypothetical protein
MFSYAGEAAAPDSALVPTDQVGAWIQMGSYACYKVGQYTSIRGAEIKPLDNIILQ